MYELTFELQNSWPKLAWVAVLQNGLRPIRILHGPSVEVCNDWAVEAVWNGCFENGDFDKSDLVYGSGIRRRDNEIVFVSSATGIDRLWYLTIDQTTYVANTLPGLLQVAEVSLLNDYVDYASDISSINTRGLYSYVRQIPADKCCINIVYFRNLLWTVDGLSEIDKISPERSFSDYGSYITFLENTSRGLGLNAKSRDRKHKVELLVGLSTGYDSVACAILANLAGCKDAVSIENATSLWRGSDSAKDLLPYLSLDCKYYKHDTANYKNESAIWAGSGASGGRNLSLFDYPEPLCLFVSGGYGDTVWERSKQGLNEPEGDDSELVCEFRLIQGVFMTQVPWWGIRQAADIQKISLLEEMKPWTIGTDYDRPIPRRLAEEAGVPRHLFGIRKKNTASNTPFWWPSTEEGDQSFREFLLSIGVNPLPKPLIRPMAVFCNLIRLINDNLLFFVSTEKKWKPWLKSPVRHLFFIWANHSLRDKHYQ